MKNFTNKKIRKKIVIVLLFILVVQIVVSKPVHAVDADVLLKPIVNLFVSLADGIMSLLQTTVMQNDDIESLIKIDGDNGFWSAVIVTAVFVIGTALAIISALPTGGGSVIAWVSFAGSAALTVTVSGIIYAVSFSTFTTIVSDQIADTYYLPMYEVSPYEIFNNKILLFDVNFFNPKEENVSTRDSTREEVGNGQNGYYGGQSGRYTSCIPENLFVEELRSQGISVDESKISVINETSETLLYNGYDSNSIVDHTSTQCNSGEYFNSSTDYHFHNDGHYVTMQYISLKYESDLDNVEYKIEITLLRTYFNNKTSENDSGFNSSTDRNYWYSYDLYKITSYEDIVEQSTANRLQSTVASWYKALRNIAIVALLSVLIYLGIRIMLSSVGEDKAKYKQALVDWVVALCLVFSMHYIMAFSVTIVEKITDMIATIQLQDENTEEIVAQLNRNGNNVGKFGEAVELFIIDGTDDTTKVENAYDILVPDDNSDNEYKSYFFKSTSLEENATQKSEAKVLLWPANNFMEQARIKWQILGEDGEERSIQYGYAITYIVLVLYTLIFCFVYLRRVIYMAFLTIIAPLVAVTYPIDKMNDGKAQAFDMWFKEYIFNLLLQPLHLVLYMILIGSAMTFASENIFYTILALGFFVPAEKLIRKFFGFEKAQTPRAFDGATGSALMMAGLNKLMHPKSPRNSSNFAKDSNHSEEKIKTSPMNEKADNLIGASERENDNEEREQEIRTEDDNIDGTVEGQDEWSASDEIYTPNVYGDENLFGSSTVNFGIGNNDEEERELPIRTNQGNIGDSSEEQSGWSASDENYSLNVNGDKNTLQNSTIAFGQNNRKTSDNNKASSNRNTKNIHFSSSKKKPRIRRKSPIRGIKRGVYAYFKGPNGLVRKMQEKRSKNGGIIQKAAGVATAGALFTAAGIVGITSGDPSKAVQYMAAGAAGGYALGKGAVSHISDTFKVEGTMQGAKKGYYGDEYEEHQQEKYEKLFVKDKANLERIEEKLHIERKEAKETAKKIAVHTRAEGVNNVDDALAVQHLIEKGYTKRESLEAVGYNNLVLNGKNTKSMKNKDRIEYQEGYKNQLIKRGIGDEQASKQTDRLFDAMDAINEFKN